MAKTIFSFLMQSGLAESWHFEQFIVHSSYSDVYYKDHNPALIFPTIVLPGWGASSWGVLGVGCFLFLTVNVWVQTN